MKTRIFLVLILLVVGFGAKSQNIYGVIKNSEGQPLSGVKVSIESIGASTVSDYQGNFMLGNLKNDYYQVAFALPGFYTTFKSIAPSDFNTTISIVLYGNSRTLEEVQVSSTRSSSTATSATMFSSKGLEKKNFGQDLPFLLDATPSVVTTSDAGAGVGYTGIRIRGVDASRINVTINGIPVNDPESHDVYWVNMPDLASSIENIQIQRGVGSSTNGAASFGASLNIKTQDIEGVAGGAIDNSYGSFNTWKTTIKATTGLINQKFSLETRLSRISSDGFIDRANSNLKSFYLAGSYSGKKTLIKAVMFSGKEVTYQSWYGTPESRIKGDTAAMNAYADRNYLTDEERANLLNSGRTYNYYTYKNQEDNYQQDNYQLHFTHSFKQNLILNLAGHYTYGRGFYEEYKTNQNLNHYGMSNVVTGSDTITSTDLIRRRWLDNDFVGAVYSLTYNKSRFHLVFGGAANTYFGRHFGEVIWARNASDSELGDRYYNENGRKTEFSNYLKAYYHLHGFVFSGDLQYRNVNYSFLGIDQVSGVLKDVQQSVQFNFFNPKASVSYRLNSNNQFFVSYGISHREPVRRDFRESTPQSRPKAEQMRDLEVGHTFQVNSKKQGSKFALTSNVYWMDYTNQLILTGKINDVGGYTRINVPKSYRAGIELYAYYKVVQGFVINGTITLSKNQIQSFDEYVDVYYDTLPYYDQKLIQHKNTNLALSPNIVGNIGFSLVPFNNFTVDWMTKFVGKQYLDNTSDINRSMNPFNYSNLNLSYSLKKVLFEEIVFGLQINNIFNQMYANNGYTFSYIYGVQTTTENFYYPQAGTNLMGRILIKL
jgi:iron complex outermembrane receptor protein